MSIVDFIIARIAEDERIAQTSIDVTYRTFRPAGEWTFTDGEEEAERESQRRYGGRIKVCVHARVRGGNFTLDTSGNPRTQNPDLIHIARHDPARVLRQCAALRASVDAELVNLEIIDGEWGDGCSAERIRRGECSDRGRLMLSEVLRSLAAIWSDHPDYRQEWKL